METILEDLVEEWKKVSIYKDVETEYWKPKRTQLIICPNGCNLEILEEDTSTKWAKVPGRDAYRQTRICRKHGFARIYIITGPTAQASNWNPQTE